MMVSAQSCILQNPEISATMKNDEKLEDLSITICFKNSEKAQVSSMSDDLLLTSVDENFSRKPASNLSAKLNFKSGFASKYFEKIVQHDDLNHAREKKWQKEDASIKDRLSKFAKLTSRNLVKAGNNRLDNDTLCLMMEHWVEKKRLDQERIESFHPEWQSVLTNGSELMSTQKLENAWTEENYKTVLKSLRRNKSEKFPIRKNDLVQLHSQWRTRN